MTEIRDSMKELVGEVLARRDTDVRYRSGVARGLDRTTEHYAYPWVLRFVDQEKDKTAYLRAAGLCATYRDIPQANKPLGASLRALSLHRSGAKSLDPAEPDVIASRLASLQEQDLEQAAATIRRFLDLARGTGVGFDFYRIGRLLSRWGNGFTEASQTVRIKTIGDYYGAWTLTPTEPATTTAQEN
ncbi:type I-E CRISPR-associated protein Cse2/CasB [Arthrobacter sp. ISL-28]|uniref:type I-E CRISPR-associated protein Cse2/CasB n=1 Tax=Arthrobacter sp. ISL-28 TaxID=2819108 RepID=UPI001BEB01DE|nr:type I-E CRISPR-associated protein Cse2/CasB [Arthrobacter sp. ISL-28]MBT2520862.1 type I-E CRISPR-associated protein Cse2/CasB [Arthrobacter sp. ISL-28]